MVAYYHIAAMGHWREVVMEQLSDLRGAPLQRICVGVLGTEEASWWADQALRISGLPYELRWHGANLTRYEIPTLEWMQTDVASGQASPVAYLHTKGVSQPSDRTKLYWRQLMMRQLLQDMSEGMQGHELRCACWSHDAAFPHACGNFWLASADYIRRLPLVAEHQQVWMHHPNRWDGPRLAAETWPGCGNPSWKAPLWDEPLWHDWWWDDRPELQQELIRWRMKG